PKGALTLDDGAVRAVVERHSSLLPAGICAVEGGFSAGEPVELRDLTGRAIARGLVNFDAKEIPQLLGRSTHELARELGPAYEREVVHRDDLVVLVPRHTTRNG
ncbi:MAG TPA: PUA domain-containing protein, partial [Streptomyces sp.]